jgi:hypothetical protein
MNSNITSERQSFVYMPISTFDNDLRLRCFFISELTFSLGVKYTNY